MPSFSSSRVRHVILALSVLASLGACGPAAVPRADLINDPQEAQNRSVHEFNRSLDRALVRPASRGYGSIVPAPVRTGVGNLASNLNQPGYVVNNILQFRIGQASQNFARFLINTTIGIGGIFDPATAMGVPEAETDFGETLHVWGVGEGPYMELPIFGPSTARDTVGLVVDTAMNPLRHLLGVREGNYALGVRVASRFGDRYRYADVVDELLYESADSYGQARLLYLQNRRFELRGAGDTSYFDPYEDSFVDPYEDLNLE